MTESIALGDVARDTITGFEGTVVAETNWLNNCRRLTLQPSRLQENGQPVESCTFDEPGVALIRRASEPVRLARTGGPRPEPVRHGHR